MSEDGKKTECIKVWLSERLFKQCAHEAAIDDRKLSDFIGLCLDRYLNGNSKQKSLEGLDRAD